MELRIEFQVWIERFVGTETVILPGFKRLTLIGRGCPRVGEQRVGLGPELHPLVGPGGLFGRGCPRVGKQRIGLGTEVHPLVGPGGLFGRSCPRVGEQRIGFGPKVHPLVGPGHLFGRGCPRVGEQRIGLGSEVHPLVGPDNLFGRGYTRVGEQRIGLGSEVHPLVGPDNLFGRGYTRVGEQRIGLGPKVYPLVGPGHLFGRSCTRGATVGTLCRSIVRKRDRRGSEIELPRGPVFFPVFFHRFAETIQRRGILLTTLFTRDHGNDLLIMLVNCLGRFTSRTRQRGGWFSLRTGGKSSEYLAHQGFRGAFEFRVSDPGRARGTRGIFEKEVDHRCQSFLPHCPRPILGFGWLLGQEFLVEFAFDRV